MITESIIEVLDTIQEKNNNKYKNALEHYKFNIYINKIKQHYSFDIKDLSKIDDLNLFGYIDCFVSIYQMDLSTDFISQFMPFYSKFQQNLFGFINKFRKHIDKFYYNNPQQVRIIVESFIFYIEKEVKISDINSFIKKVNDPKFSIEMKLRDQINFIFYSFQYFLEILVFYTPNTKINIDVVDIPISKQADLLNSSTDNRYKYESISNAEIALGFNELFGTILANLTKEEETEVYKLLTARSGGAVFASKSTKKYKEEANNIRKKCKGLRNRINIIIKVGVFIKVCHRLKICFQNNLRGPFLQMPMQT